MYDQQLGRFLVVGLADDPPDQLPCAASPTLEHSFSRLLENDVLFIQSKSVDLCYTNGLRPKLQVTTGPKNGASKLRSLTWLLVCLVSLLIVISLIVYLLYDQKRLKLGRTHRGKAGQLPKLSETRSSRSA